MHKPQQVIKHPVGVVSSNFFSLSLIQAVRPEPEPQKFDPRPNFKL